MSFSLFGVIVAITGTASADLVLGERPIENLWAVSEDGLHVGFIESIGGVLTANLNGERFEELSSPIRGSLKIAASGAAMAYVVKLPSGSYVARKVTSNGVIDASPPHASLDPKSLTLSIDGSRLVLKCAHRITDKMATQHFCVDGVCTTDGLSKIEGPIVFSPSGKRWAAIGQEGGVRQLVLDGEKQAPPDWPNLRGFASYGPLPGSIVFGPDDRDPTYMLVVSRGEYNEGSAFMEGLVADIFFGILGEGRREREERHRDQEMDTDSTVGVTEVPYISVVSSNEASKPIKTTGNMAWSQNKSVWSIAGRIDGRSYVVIDGYAYWVQGGLGSGVALNSAGTASSFVEKVGKRRRINHNMIPGDAFDRIDPQSLRYSLDGSRLIYSALVDKGWTIQGAGFVSRQFEEIDPESILVSGDGSLVLYEVRIGGRSFVFGNDSPSFGFDAIYNKSLGISPVSNTHAFVASKDGISQVIVNFERRFDVEDFRKPLTGWFSPAGHFGGAFLRGGKWALVSLRSEGSTFDTILGEGPSWLDENTLKGFALRGNQLVEVRLTAGR